MPSLIRRQQVAGMNIHYLFYSLDDFLDAQKQLGFESIELWAGAPHFYIDPYSWQDAKEVRRKIDSRGLHLVCFTPENCTYPWQVGAQTLLLIEKSYQYFSNGLAACAELECPLMQINSGWGYANEPREEAWKRARDMLSRLADRAGQLGITIVMESLRPQESQLMVTLADTKRMFDEVASPHLKILLDTVAMSVSGETIQDWFNTFGPDIRHMHFIDCNPYGHLAWGKGDRNMQDMLETLQANGYTGALGQELTEFDYFQDPITVDRQNMAQFAKYF